MDVGPAGRRAFIRGITAAVVAAAAAAGGGGVVVVVVVVAVAELVFLCN